MKLSEFFIEQESSQASSATGVELSVRDQIPLIARDCKPFLAQADGLPMYRGIKDIVTPKLSLHPVNRSPVDSPAFYNFFYNAMMYAAFGIKDIRTKALFVSGSRKVAKEYGAVNYVFPKGNIKFTWSPHAEDSYTADNIFFTKILDSTSVNSLEREQLLSDYFGTVEFKNFLRKLTNVEHFSSTWWIDKDTTSAATALWFKDLTAVDDPKIREKLIASMVKVAKKLYSFKELSNALASDKEIMIYKSEGYYTIPCKLVDIIGQAEDVNYNHLLEMIQNAV